MKKLLIIGAGKYQLSGIKTANKMGIYTISIDGNSQAPGFEVSDEYYNIDIKDIDRIKEIADEEKIEGVVSFASEVTLPVAAKISDYLNLHFLDYQTAKRATNKFLQRKIFEENGVNSPGFYLIKNKDELKNIPTDLKPPLIIKPVDNSGSRGVFKVKNSNLEDYYYKSKKFSSNGDVIVEEFVNGVEFTVEAFANHDGTVTILGVSKKQKQESDYRVATELQYNKIDSLDLYNSICNVTKEAIKALQIKNTITHSEVIVEEKTNKVYPVEVAARSGGFGIFDKILPYISGVNVVEKLILASLGKKVKIESSDVAQKSAILKFIVPPPGVLENISLNKYEAMQGEKYEIDFFKDEGEEVEKLSSDGKRTGYIITYDEEYEKAKKLAEEIYSSIEITVC